MGEGEYGWTSRRGESGWTSRREESLGGHLGKSRVWVDI